MKQYKFIYASEIGRYNDWEIIKIIDTNPEVTYVIIMKEDIPVQAYIKLHEATCDQLIEELAKRLKKEEIK